LTNQKLSYKLDVEAAKQHADKAKKWADAGLVLPDAGETTLINRSWNINTDRMKILMYAGELDAALIEVRQIREEISDPELEDILRGYDRKVAYFASQEGEILIDMGRGAEAIEALEISFEIYKSYALERPNHYYFLTQSLRLGGMLSFATRAAGQGQRSIDVGRQAVGFAQQLRELDPQDVGSRQYLATQQEHLAKALAAFGDIKEAQAIIEEAISVRAALVREFPKTISHRRDYALTLKDAGIVYGKVGNRTKQCQTLGQAKDIFDELLETNDLTEFDKTKRMDEITQLLSTAKC